MSLRLVVLPCAGLSDSFIMLDDDFFLTAPWTLGDFLGPDGGQILTGEHRACAPCLLAAYGLCCMEVAFEWNC
jgi:hypothetical protein